MNLPGFDDWKQSETKGAAEQYANEKLDTMYENEIISAATIDGVPPKDYDNAREILFHKFIDEHYSIR